MNRGTRGRALHLHIVAALVVASCVAGLYLGDWTLRQLGEPAEPHLRVAHPPHFNERREYLEFSYEFTTNAEGLRDRDRSIAKAPDTRRILVAGDSYTEGLGVAADGRFSDRLEQDFARPGVDLQFINGGLSGTGPLEYARLFSHIGLRYDLDGLLICLFANDVANTTEDSTRLQIDPRKASRVGVRKHLHGQWPHIYTLLQTVRTHRAYRQATRTSDFVAELSRQGAAAGIPSRRIESWRSTLPANVIEAINAGKFGTGILSYGLLYPAFWTDSIDVATTRSESKLANMLQVLDSMVRDAHQHGVEVAVVYLPVMFQYDPDSHGADNLWVRTGTNVRLEWLTGTSEVEARLDAWASAHGLPFLSLTGSFREATSPQSNLNYPLDGHWTSAGHAVAARAIGHWLAGARVFEFMPPVE